VTIHSVLSRLERVSNILDSEDLAKADSATLERLRSLSEALAAAIAAEQAHRADHARWRAIRRHPAWTLPGFRALRRNA
jgi:hypothetical protein